MTTKTGPPDGSIRRWIATLLPESDKTYMLRGRLIAYIDSRYSYAVSFRLTPKHAARLITGVNRTAVLLTLTSGIVTIAFPQAYIVTGAVSIAMACVYMVSYERTRIDFERIETIATNASVRLAQHSISLEGLDARVDKHQPGRHTAAAIMGQGELATKGFPDVEEWLRHQGLIPPR